jgi:hypothetical protein
MSEKKIIHMESPNMNKLQAVVIVHQTTIYIAKMLILKALGNAILPG